MFALCSIENGPETLLQQRPALTTTRKDRAVTEQPNIAIDYLRQCVSYIPETGRFEWKARPVEHFKSDHARKRINARFAGKAAGTTKADTGYQVIRINGWQVYCHRAAYAIMTDAWPEGQIDHINGLRADNRWVNLRAVTLAENRKNMKRYATNTSGVTGVHFDENRWVASIHGIGGKMVRIGSYEKFEDAVIARKAAEKVLGYHPGHGRAASPGAANQAGAR